jgi:hypothetical protein
LQDFWRRNGVKSTQSLPYTPQHNGKAERLNRTLVEKARATLAQAKAPRALWGQAVMTAAYLHNLTHMSAGDNCVALQKFTRRSDKPSAAHLKVFGSTAFVKLPAQLVKHKFDPIGVKMVFVGYEEPRGWKFIAPSNPHTIVASRNAIFMEQDFSMMQLLREKLIEIDEINDVEDDEYFGSLALSNEIKLMQLISREEQAAKQAAQQALQQAKRVTLPRSSRVVTADFEPISSPSPEPSPEPSVDEEEEEKETMPLAKRKRGRRRRTPFRITDVAEENILQGPRTRRPVARLGLVDPRDIGQALTVQLMLHD